MSTNTSNNFLTTVAIFLSSIGAINWGLIAVFEFNLVEFLLGSYPLAAKVTYSLVGLSGLYCLIPAWNMACSGWERLS